MLALKAEALALIQRPRTPGLAGQPPDLRMRALDEDGHLLQVSFSLGRLVALTRAELEVARWAHAGHSNGVIAHERQTTIHTVAKQMTAAMGKLRIGARLWLATIPELNAWSPPGLGIRAADSAPLDSPASKTGREVEAHDVARTWWEVAAGHWSTLVGVDVRGLRHAVMSRDSTRSIDWQVLSTTHRNVLALVVECFPQKAIALKLGMAPSTVSAALDSTRRRLGFDSLSQLVRAYCAVRDLIE
jgi:DNA-binding NarL/FixJ family response regulator